MINVLPANLVRDHAIFRPTDFPDDRFTGHSPLFAEPSHFMTGFKDPPLAFESWHEFLAVFQPKYTFADFVQRKLAQVFGSFAI